MAKIKVKLNLRAKSDSDLLTFAQQHQTAMTGNANFTTPLPSAANYTTALTAYSTALGSSNTAQAAAKLATTVKDTARLALESVLAQRGNYVELIAAPAADPVAVVESAAFGVKAAPGTSAVPEMVASLSVTAGDTPGQLDLQWDPMPGAKTYDIAVSPDPATEATYVAKPSVTKSKATVTGLTSGSKVWVRVRAVGAGGTGPWSDPATKIVP